MSNKPSKGIMNAFLTEQPKIVFGGKKEASKKAYYSGNSAPKNFKPSGKINK